MATPSSNTTSRPRPASRPTTPLRRSSRDSLRRDSTTTNLATHPFPLDHLTPQFAELSDALTDLDANFMDLQLMQESMSRFCESFSAFLYGMEVNAFCVDFTEYVFRHRSQRVLRGRRGGRRSSTERRWWCCPRGITGGGAILRQR
ncbi:DASH complex subunit Dam1-domain-containing protein [Tirmania nivea]|nr:DASH complex subunit Dam1-domain-containing protein [Tirmania nivea]